MFKTESVVDNLIQRLVRKNVQPGETEADYWNRHWQKQSSDFQTRGIPPEVADDWWRNLYDEMVDHYEKRLGSLDGLRVCELGAGSGYASLLMAKRGAHVDLVDFSHAAHAYAKTLAAHLGVPEMRVACTHGDLFSADLPTRGHDVVWNCGVIEHYPWTQAVELVRTMARHARPGGTVMVTLPNLLSPELIYRMAREGKGTEIYFSHRLLKRLMEEAGLRTVSVTPINYWVPSFFPHAWANRLRGSSFGERFKGLCWLFNGIGTVPV